MSANPIADLVPEIPGFVLEAEIGRGSSGRVFRARQVALDRAVAIKVIATPGEAGRRRALRLFREARVAGALDHPGLVRAIDAGEGDGFCWFAMELVLGRDLEAILEDLNGPLPPLEVVRIGREALAALDHAHRRGVVHRDVKPANIVLERGGRVRVLDLGLARREADPRITQEGGALGTPQYMAPEQARGSDQADARADLFSLAATLYRALSGEPPFGGANIAEVLTRLLYEEPKPLSSMVPNLPRGLEQTLLRALSKAPQRRFRDAAHFGLALSAIANGRDPELGFDGRRLRARIAWTAGILAVVAALGLGIWSRIATKANTMVPARSDPAAESLTERVPSEALRSLRRTVEASARESRDALVGRLSEARSLFDQMAPFEHEPALREFRILEQRWRSVLLAEAELIAQRAKTALAEEHPAAFQKALQELEGLLEPVSAVAPGAALRTYVAERRDELAALRVETSAVVLNRMLLKLSVLEARGAPAGSTRESVARDVASALASEGDEARQLLSRDDTARLSRRRDEVAELLLSAPQRRAERFLADAEIACRALAFERARALVRSAREIGGAVFALDAERVERVIDAEIQALNSSVRASTQNLWRRDEAALEEVERRHRTEQLKERLDSLPDEVSAVSELGPTIVRAKAVLAGAESALALEADLLTVAPGLVVQPRSFRLERLRERASGEYRVLGVTDDQLELRRLADGLRTTVEPASLTAAVVEELLIRAKKPPASAALAIRAHWDGHDGQASEYVARVEDEALRAELEQMVERGVAQQGRSFDRAEERQAAREFAVAQHLATREKDQEAIAILASLLKRGSAGTGISFWRAKGKDIADLLRELQLRERVKEALGPWRPFCTLLDTDSRVLRFTVLPNGESLPFLALPPGAEITGKTLGRIAPAIAGPVAATLEELRPLSLELPDIAWNKVSVRFDLFCEGPRSPQMCGITAGNVTFVGFESLKDGQRHGVRALHGVQRELYANRPVRQGTFYLGEIARFREALRTSPLGFRLAAGELPVEIQLDRMVLPGKGHSARISIQEQSYALSPRGKALTAGPLTVRVGPEFRLDRLEVELMY